MKTTTCILFFLSTMLSLSAQVQKGSIAIGLDLSGTYSNTHHVDTYRSDKYNKGFGIGPNACFFVKKNLGIGVALSYSYTLNYTYNLATANNSSSEDQLKQNTNSVNLAPYFRYYWCLNKVFAIVPQVTASVSYGNGQSSELRTNTRNGLTSVTNTYGNINTLSYGVNFTPSFVFWPHPQYGIEFAYASVGYNGVMRYTKTWDIIDNTQTFGFNFGPSSLRLGFKYYLFPKSSKKTDTKGDGITF